MGWFKCLNIKYRHLISDHCLAWVSWRLDTVTDTRDKGPGRPALPPTSHGRPCQVFPSCSSYSTSPFPPMLFCIEATNNLEKERVRYRGNAAICLLTAPPIWAKQEGGGHSCGNQRQVKPGSLIDRSVYLNGGVQMCLHGCFYIPPKKCSTNKLRTYLEVLTTLKAV